MPKGKLFAFALLFILTPLMALAALDVPTGFYNKKEVGFYVKNFDRSPDSLTPACKKFQELLLRGGKPDFNDSTEAWIHKLLDNNVALVVDLRNESTDMIKEKTRLSREGVDYVRLPLRTEGSDQEAYLTVEEQKAVGMGQVPVTSKSKLKNVEATLKVIKRVEDALASGKRVYLHCQRGEDRTGMFIGLLRNCSDYSREFNSYGGVLYPALAKHMRDVQTVRNK